MRCQRFAARPDRLETHGVHLVKGVSLPGFKDDEDTEVELLHHPPFSLEDELKGSGARHVSKATWEPHVVVDGPLMTGQSPASAAPLAQARAERPKALRLGVRNPTTRRQPR